MSPTQMELLHEVSRRFDLHADGLESYAARVLAAAQNCMDATTWTEEEEALAAAAIGQAYAARDRAQFLHSYATHVREDLL